MSSSSQNRQRTQEEIDIENNIFQHLFDDDDPSKMILINNVMISDVHKEGDISYYQASNADFGIDGLFSFSFYIPSRRDDVDQNTISYLQGIFYYLHCVGAGSNIVASPFQSWRILLYIDDYTLDRLLDFEFLLNTYRITERNSRIFLEYLEKVFPGFQNIITTAEQNTQLYLNNKLEDQFTEQLAHHLALSDTNQYFYSYRTPASSTRNPNPSPEIHIRWGRLLLKHPKLILAIVDWPEYNRQPHVRAINGEILRVMRMRALFDFNHIPVFIRDADTIFAVRSRSLESSTIRMSPDEVLQWETVFYNQARNFPGTYLCGSDLQYQKSWHSLRNLSQHEVNQFLPQGAIFGAFAGFQNAMPLQQNTNNNIPCFGQNNQNHFPLWEQIIQFLRERSRRTNVQRSALNEQIFQRQNRFNTSSTRQTVSNQNLASEGLNPQEIAFIRRGMPEEELAQLRVQWEQYKKQFKAWKNNTVSTPPIQPTIREHIIRRALNTSYLYTNTWARTRLGRDEQIITFILLPACLQNVRFIQLPLISGNVTRINDIPNYFSDENNNALRQQFLSATQQPTATTTTTTTSSSSSMNGINTTASRKKHQQNNETMGGGTRRMRKQKKRKTRARK